jgi:hypothetical protein|tara:strand:+ start:449 stop:631 length:183 start_codon:yes stop_codon:yes gene_type:complete
MSKSSRNLRKSQHSSFSQKKREYYENADLSDSGYLDMLSNRQRINKTKDLDYDELTDFGD